MRFGVCTGVENIGLVKTAGYDYIELNFTQITQMRSPVLILRCDIIANMRRNLQPVP